MIVLICGDRNWGDYRCTRCKNAPWPCPECLPSNRSMKDAALRELKSLGVSPETDEVVEGDARGADRMGGEAAAALGFTRGVNLHVMAADWNRYGRAAGPIRNQQQLDLLIARTRSGINAICLAFHRDLSSSKGTKDMVERCRRAGIEVRVLTC